MLFINFQSYLPANFLLVPILPISPLETVRVLIFGSTVTGAQVESTGSGGTFKAGIDAKWIELSASRDTASNFTGGLDQTDKLHAKFRIQVTPLIGFALSLDRVTIDELNENVIDYSRTYTVITPAMNLSLAHNLNLRAVYSYYTNEYKSLAQGETERNRFSVNLKYDFPLSINRKIFFRGVFRYNYF